MDGYWAEWSEWGSCSVSCGDKGTRIRNRTCSDPMPQHGGESCAGNKTETELCDEIICPGNLINEHKWRREEHIVFKVFNCDRLDQYLQQL